MKKNKQEQDIISEFTWDSMKFINKFLNDWTPIFWWEDEFKDKLNEKINSKIKSSNEQKINQEIIDSIPKKLKRRFYLTWYWYAICSFLILFLIWFCTNIFTWSINIPSKYNKLEQPQAFWNLHNISQNLKELNTNKNSSISYSKNTNNNQNIKDKEKLQQQIKPTDVRKTNYTESFITNKTRSDLLNNENDIFLSDWFTYNNTYRFTFKEKSFPKLNSEYPVYKSSGTMTQSNTAEQLLKNFKIWDIQLWKFQNIEIKRIEINQNTKNWYYIEFDEESLKLNIYPNNTRQAKKYDKKLPSSKSILKDIEKNMKLLWISLKNYWNWIVYTDSFDQNIWTINILYPFKIQWKTIWNPEKEKQIWMEVSYDLNIWRIVSIIWIDIASYNISNYPSINKEILESDISQGWSYFKQWAIHKDSTPVLFDKMEIVYIEKITESWDLIYIPAIRWSISSSLKNYTWPSHIYEEII